jgi:hypothetical protein
VKSPKKQSLKSVAPFRVGIERWRAKFGHFDANKLREIAALLHDQCDQVGAFADRMKVHAASRALLLEFEIPRRLAELLTGFTVYQLRLFAVQNRQDALDIEALAKKGRAS